jgi:hypothetical protein
VEGEEVGHPDELLEPEQLDVDLPGPLRGHEGIVGHDLHPERRGSLSHQLADAPEADDAEHLVGQLHAFPAAALPTAFGERGVGLGDVAGLGEQQRHRVLGGGEDVRLRGVDHHHALRGGCLCVDVVEPDPGPTDHDEVLRGRQHVGGDVGGRPDDQRVRAGHRLEELLRGEIELEIHLVAGGAEPVEPAVGDLLGDQDPRHGRRVWSGAAETRQPIGNADQDEPLVRQGRDQVATVPVAQTP